MFQWTFRHCRIPGNEKVDSLAKHGCDLPQPSGSLSCRQSFSNISRSVGNYIRRIPENDARGKIWETLIHSPVLMGLPRQRFSAVCRTLTGLYFLQ
ncbi:RNase H domain-containing protein [Trichonephila clavipes]|nr:RNase H domain-containing protein [Trichonephila clavipes]